MTDEQPGHIARDVRDVTKVPLAAELVKDNVGSTVTQRNSNFTVVSQDASAAASALYLDPSLQARIVRPPTATSAAAGNTGGIVDGASAIPSGGSEANVKCAHAGKEEFTRPGQASHASHETGRPSHNEGPLVIMSDADKHRPNPDRRKNRMTKQCCTH
ncbi:unnamed protein product [Ectocarpus sp. 6 AP-2014]